MIFYFTGTGNSLYVAKQLDKDIRSIPKVIKEENLSFKDEKIGIVCPVYAHEMPSMVKNFLRKAKFETNYFFVILTYGNVNGGAAEITNNMLTEMGINADYINTIIMVDNFLPGFDMDKQREIDSEKKVDEHIIEIKKDIKELKHYLSPVTETDRKYHEAHLKRCANMTSNPFKNLYNITDKCKGCGICVKVCPGGCIEIKDNKAVHNSKGCELCMACVHNCPEKAIELNMKEPNPNARYRNEHISLKEIIAANNQQ